MFQTMDMSYVGELYHVGTMDASKKGSYSLEGDGLSVSNCPDAWIRIGEGMVRGDLFLLKKEGTRLLDFSRLSEEERKEISDWAVNEDLVCKGTAFKAVFYGEDGEYFSLHRTREEAIAEVEEEESVIPVPTLYPTDKLLAMTAVRIELLQVFDIVCGIYAEKVLGYDGMWWDETLDEWAYSAPRGVIFTSKLDTFNVERQ